jgi:hypothetical protein
MPPRGDHYATVATATDVPQAAVWTLWLMRSNNDKLWLIGGGVLFILYTMGGGGILLYKSKPQDSMDVWWQRCKPNIHRRMWLIIVHRGMWLSG